MDFAPNVKEEQIKAFLRLIRSGKKMPQLANWLDDLGNYHNMLIPLRSGHQTKEALLNKAKALITDEQENGQSKDADKAIRALECAKHVKFSHVYPLHPFSGVDIRYVDAGYHKGEEQDIYNIYQTQILKKNI